MTTPAERKYIDGIIGRVQVRCLANGHRWPEVVPGERAPSGMDINPAPGGGFEIRENCQRGCGTVRVSTTLSRGRFFERYALPVRIRSRPMGGPSGNGGSFHA